MRKGFLTRKEISAVFTHPQDAQSGAHSASASKEGMTGLIWALLGIFALAFGLRVWGIDFGLPYELTPDEGHEIRRALKLGAGEYYWGFGKGGLYFILFVEYAFLYVVWWLTDRIAGANDFAMQVVRDPTMFFLLGRLTVAIMGTLTCLVVFHVGERLYNRRVGLVAAFIGATAYVHGTHSHLINVDIGMTLAMWASLLAYLKYEKSGGRRWLIGAGILAGIAIAFKLPGAIILPALFLAIGSRLENWRYPRAMVKESGVVLLTTFATLTIIAPEWIVDLRANLKPYSTVTNRQGATTGAFEGGRKEAFRLVTTLRGSDWTGHVRSLARDHNLLLTVCAVIGAGLGFINRHRWSVVFSAVTLLFVAVMSASNRSQPEYYLLPIVPCLWLLASQAIIVLTRRYFWLTAIAIACVVALPLTALVRQNVEWTQPDTRIVAKQWIETNIPSGAKILADSYQYRFTPSPPLTPDRSSVLRQFTGVSNEPDRFRGMSKRTLEIYAQAMELTQGPKYELHPTVWGLAVEDAGFYAERCFDYIITSSMISKRYEGDLNRQRFPKSARFYEQLDNDARLRKIYAVEPVPWQRPGPEITVYKLRSSCGTAEKRAAGSIGH